MPQVVSVVVAFSCVGGAAAANGKTLINDPHHLEHLNRENVANSSWVAGVSSFFEGLTFDDARPLLGTSLSHIEDHLDEVLPDSAYDKDADIPAEFDARTKWPGLIHPIRDQQRCGSCWAFSASEVLGDRTSIAMGRNTPVLSPEDMVSCDGGDRGCSGGRLDSAWSYLQNTGIVSDSCFPYSAGGGEAPTCSQKCSNREDWNSSKVKAATAYAIKGVSHMQQEIMTKGPIQVAFLVFKSFMSYKSGVYQRHWYEILPEGGHAVKIVGWGTEDGIDYWLVANSWNTTWGLDGYFKIKRGSNACGIEKMGPPYAGTAAVSELVV